VWNICQCMVVQSAEVTTPATTRWGYEALGGTVTAAIRSIAAVGTR